MSGKNQGPDSSGAGLGLRPSVSPRPRRLWSSRKGRSPTHAWLRTQLNCQGTGPPCMGWEEGPSVLTEITAHVFKSGLSRDCPLGVIPGPPGLQVPAAQYLWELKPTPAGGWVTPARRVCPRFLERTTCQERLILERPRGLLRGKSITSQLGAA